MAYAGQTIENPVTGQTFIFEATEHETGGALFRFEGRFKPGGFAGALHIHPLQEELFEVLEGTAVIQVGDKETRLQEGETLIIPAGQAHTYWNGGEGALRIINEFKPALACTGNFYEFMCGLARSEQLNKDGLPKIWQIALQAGEFSDHVRLANPPWCVQRMIFGLLQPVARLLGYRPLDFTEAKPQA